MDDFTDGYREGWNAALEAAENICRPVWLDTGMRGRACPDVELVWLRKLPEQAKKAVET